MKKILLLATAAITTTILSGCGDLNTVLADRHESEEIYHIFDAKTQASPDAIIKAASDGVARNTNNVTSARPLNLHASKTIPTEPGRFDVIDVADELKGAGLGGMSALMSLSQGNAGQNTLKQAKCPDALWTAKAVRSVPGSNRLDLYICIYRYAKGYNVDMYANFVKTSGGINALSQAVASAAIGTPEEWVNKTIIDTMRSIQEKTGATISHVEGQPELGNMPWVDKYDTTASK
jgi:hypothetical protein